MCIIAKYLKWVILWRCDYSGCLRRKMGKTMQKKSLSVLLIGALLTASASASVINFSSRASSAGPFASGVAYKSYIDGLTAAAPGAGYCDAALSSFSNISNQVVCHGGNRNVAFHFQTLFGVAANQSGTWGFRAGVDFGRGGAMFLDGVLLDWDSSDLWWAGNFNASSEILAASGVNLNAGNHVLDIYGLEGCCDGTQAAQFQIGTQQWTTFSVGDRQDSRVPLPATLALLGIGAAAVRLTRKQ